LSFVAGVGLTSKNVLSAVVGDRYTEKDLKNEKQLSYKAGFESGKDEGLKSGNAVGYDSGFEAGDDAGYSRGYVKGENDGCYKVFKKAEADQLIAIFYPYRASDTGEFYITRSSTC
jgi:flagellar biosynthesis/type III secretory pathway protein FliH